MTKPQIERISASAWSWRSRLIAAAALLAVATAPPASASFIQFSDVSSDTTPAAYLKALMEFTVVGNTLTLTMENQTDDVTLEGYNINEIFFNTTSDVLDLVLTDAFGDDGNNLGMWTLFSGPNNDTKANGFGRYTWALKDGVDDSPETVMPGEVQTFEFTINCAGVGLCDDQDFVTEFSTNGNSHIAAAKFVMGPFDPLLDPNGPDSAYGASDNTEPAPEPTLLTLIGVGCAGLLARRRLHG